MGSHPTGQELKGTEAPGELLAEDGWVPAMLVYNFRCVRRVEVQWGEGHSYGLNCVPPKRYVGILAPVPVEVTLVRSRVFEDEIKLKRGH